MKIEESSQFLQANAVAQRVRQLILGAAPKVKTTSRRPTAIALAELMAGKLEVYDPREAAEMLAENTEDLTDEQRATAEAAAASFEQMFADTAGEEIDAEAAAESSTASEPDADDGPAETAAVETNGTEAAAGTPAE